MSNFYLTEKYEDFLLLAVLDDNRAYAFRDGDRIYYLEDIPVNYPSVCVFQTTIEDLKNEILKNLRENGWEIIVNRLE